MLQEISYFLIFGKPLIMYFGVITLCSFLATAAIPLLRQSRIIHLSFVWHPRLAGFALVLGLVHGTLGVLAYF